MPDGQKIATNVVDIDPAEIKEFLEGTKEHPIYKMSDRPKDWREADEKRFRHWYARVSKQFNLDPNPDDPEHHYNYRMAFKNGEWPDAKGHWSSRYKDALHPNRFVDGEDTTKSEPAPKRAAGGMLRIHKRPEDYTEQELSLLPTKDAERIRARNAALDTFGGQLVSGKKKLSLGSIAATPQAAMAKGYGALLDQPSSASIADRDKAFLGAVGRELIEAPFRRPEDITTPSREAAERGADLGALGLVADIGLDPLNLIGGGEEALPASVMKHGVREAPASLGQVARSLARTGAEYGVPAAAGAVIDKDNPLEGALLGAAAAHGARMIGGERAPRPRMQRGPDGQWYTPRPAAETAADVAAAEAVRPTDTAFTAEFGSPEEVRAARTDTASGNPSERPVVLSKDEPVDAMKDIGGSYLRYQAEDPQALAKADEMRLSGMKAKEALNDTHPGRGGATVEAPAVEQAADDLTDEERALFMPETSQPSEGITEPRFKGWQEGAPGEPPMALYDWPIDENGRFTTGSATDLKKAGFDVPEPTEPPPGAGSWDQFEDLHPDQVETLNKYQPQEPVTVGSEVRRFMGDEEGSVKLGGWMKRHLTPEEGAKLRQNTAQRLKDIWDELPSGKDYEAAALAGKAKKGWYEASGRAIQDIYGADAPRFANLLSALSPRVDVKANLQNAVRMWANWVEAGRPTQRKIIEDLLFESVRGNGGESGKVLPSWTNNVVRALQTENADDIVLSGPKVHSFAKNLTGNMHEVTNDTWMALFAGHDPDQGSIRMGGGLNKAGTDPGKSPAYMAMSAKVRQAADNLTKLTGETWTPAHVQETVWSWAKTLYEQAQEAGVSAQEFLKTGRLTPEAIAEAPDFALLFSKDPEVREVLERAGYGDILDRLGSASESGAGNAGAAAPTGREASALDKGRAGLVRTARRLDQIRDAREANAAATRQGLRETRWSKKSEPVPDWVTEDDGAGALEPGADEEPATLGSEVRRFLSDQEGSVKLGGWGKDDKKLGSVLTPGIKVQRAESLGGWSNPRRIWVHDADGNEVQALLKEHGPNDVEGARDEIYQSDAPGMVRDVASYRVAEALGFRLVPETHLAEVTGLDDALSGGKLAKFGMKDESRVKGSAMAWKDDVMEFGSLPADERKEVGTPEEWYQLNVLDFLLGSMDRHKRNLLVDVKPGADGVRHIHAVDNTLSFPRISPEPGRPGVKGLRLIGHGANEMAASAAERERIVQALEKTDWDEVLKDIGPKARQAFKDRLAFVKQHVADDTFKGPIKYSTAQWRD